ncbi:MAG: site-specific DNA-methyltransferase [Phycisphaerales bacterium]|nr:MAG: site-specific DNA-methyltransferase [Phycisphaerales bacterium]
MQEFLNKIICGDCIEVLGDVGEPFADLIFADPPFNIGYKYDKYYDKVKKKNYVAWTKEWMSICKKVLKPHGSFYIAIGDDYAANVKVIADELGLVMRNWIIWHYTFGQQMKRKFARSHTHILYFVRDKSQFVFNDDRVRIISDRQNLYRDKRANPDGKMPDDVWNEYPRLCGTFKERTDFPCQMPESLLARIIRVSSNEGDWVLDPFSGSGTTAVVAHKLNRTYTGIEISEKYVEESGRRIRQSEGLPVEGEGLPKWPEHADRELKWLYHENKVADGQLRTNKMLLSLFTTKLNDRLNKTQQYTPDEVTDRLEQLRKAGKLGALRGERIRSP